MSNQLLRAIEKAKESYIQKLVDLGVYKHSDPELYQLTLSEMIRLYKKYKSAK